MNNQYPKNNIIPVSLPGSINGTFNLENIDKLREKFDEILNKKISQFKRDEEKSNNSAFNENFIENNLQKDLPFDDIDDIDDIDDEFSEYYEFHPHTIFIENVKLTSNEDIAFAGLEYINSQKLSELKIIKYGNNLFKIKNFLVQIVISHPTSKSVLIPINTWIKKKQFPEIILFAQVNDESKSVYFPGVLTAQEVFNDFEIFNNPNDKEYFIPISKFKGGINRLFSIVTILKPSKLLRINWKFNKLVLSPNQRKKLVSSIEFLVFLLKTGIPLDDSYKLVSETQKDIVISSIFNHALKCHKNNINLEKALRKYPYIFDYISLALIRRGLEQNDLINQLSIISERIKKNLIIDSEIDQLFESRIFNIFMIFLIMAVVFHSNIELAWKQLDIPLLLPQKILGYLVGNIFFEWFLPFIFLFSIFYIIFYNYTWIETYRKILPKKIIIIINNILFKIPVLKEIKIKFSILCLLRNLFYLLSSGISILDSLEFAQKQEKTFLFKKIINEISQKIKKGSSLYDSIKSVNIFPDLLVTFIKVGENDGRVIDLISPLCNFYEAELFATLKVWKSKFKKYIDDFYIFASLFFAFELIMTYTITMINLINKG
tara:strand:- start:820 stop:2628 length:1809 start_codon:yes stop_codon:yes gene_type:complete